MKLKKITTLLIEVMKKISNNNKKTINPEKVLDQKNESNHNNEPVCWGYSVIGYTKPLGSIR